MTNLIAERSRSNFDLVNEAIELERGRVTDILRLRRQRRLLRWMQIAALAVGMICVIALTTTLVYWLLREPIVDANAYLNAPTSESNDIEQISQAEGASARTIDTTYTVFSRVELDSGQSVVTGKSFTPEDTKLPFEQYCYIEQVGDDRSQVGSNFLAEVFQGQVVYGVGLAELKQIADNYCRFSL